MDKLHINVTVSLTRSFMLVSEVANCYDDITERSITDTHSNPDDGHSKLKLNFESLLDIHVG